MARGGQQSQHAGALRLEERNDQDRGPVAGERRSGEEWIEGHAADHSDPRQWPEIRRPGIQIIRIALKSGSMHFVKKLAIRGLLLPAALVLPLALFAQN